MGSGIGFVLSGGNPIGAMAGGWLAETTLGKWVGNGLDATGDAIGEAIEWIGDLF